MKLLLILTSSILFLSSCTSYRYDVTYEKCNGSTGSAIFNTIPRYAVEGNIGGFPDKSIVTNASDSIITDVCAFSYTRNKIK